MSVGRRRTRITQLRTRLRVQSRLIRRLSRRLFQLIGNGTNFVPDPRMSRRRRSRIHTLHRRLHNMRGRVSFCRKRLRRHSTRVLRLHRAIRRLASHSQVLRRIIRRLPKICHRGFSRQLTSIGRQITRLRQRGHRLRTRLRDIACHLTVHAHHARHLRLPDLGTSNVSLPSFNGT